MLTELEIQLEGLRQILDKLEQLARGASMQKGRSMQQKARQCSTELSRLQRDLQHAALVSTPGAAHTHSGNTQPDFATAELGYRHQILSGTQRLEESSDRLNNAHRIAVETESIGTNVLGEMVGQRRQLENVRDNVCSLSIAHYIDVVFS